MSIYRIKKKQNYTVLCNQLLTNKDLTYEARGMLCYLLSKPHNWEVRMNDLIKASPAGTRVVRRVIGELEEHGYMRRQRVHNEDGTFTWITEVHEDPTGGGKDEETPIGTKCTDGNITMYTLSTDGKRTDIVSNELTKEKGKKMEEEGKPNTFMVYEQEIGPITPTIADEIMELEQVHPSNWICESFKECSRMGKRSLGYAKAIMQRWHAEGYGTEPKWKRSDTSKHKQQPDAFEQAIKEAMNDG